MHQVIEESILCPYCGESFSALIDGSVLPQEYTEDCQVCCQPIVFQVCSDLYGDISIRVYREDETF
ncbi:CPXCG motif-containing cysteine-rich protein [Microbulbifer echini]|uniref:CPXCG motif-containing cysteine-rich protein n=1 Tax=Microbulbifer echini TaxID=1529067 RepID=A0ABV4NN26_9GAMM|nr:CPXCG motif-containing cysteine-rich protein [uncultured Microbulbifer sp.]